MVELRKIVVFAAVTFLFIYMLWINLKVLKNFGQKKLLSAFMISGFGLISVASFFDMISNLLNINIIHNVITTCFTAGAIVFGAYLILWSNYIVKIIFKLNKSANKDPMTGLYNRKGFEELFKRKSKTQKDFYIIVFDLDKTKVINDNFGHQKGDKYITDSATIIKEEIGKNGFIGRTGGDEFVAYAGNINEEEVEKIIFYIKDRVTKIFRKEKTQISIGYAVYGRDGKDLGKLMRIADKRMYNDKKIKNEYKVYF